MLAHSKCLIDVSSCYFSEYKHVLKLARESAKTYRTHTSQLTSDGLCGFANLFCPQSCRFPVIFLSSGNDLSYIEVDLQMMVNTNKISGKDFLSPQLCRDH